MLINIHKKQCYISIEENHPLDIGNSKIRHSSMVKYY